MDGLTDKGGDQALSKRRCFQPSITRYFAAVDSDVVGGASSDLSSDSMRRHHYGAPAWSSAPVVPASIQTKLLQVGMRVRKSVAEGYRTELEEQKAAAAAARSSYAPDAGDGRKRNYANYYQHAELAPFCGAYKTGDAAAAVPSMAGNVSWPACSSKIPASHLVMDDGEAVSLPSSSQESMSSVSSISQSQKRSYDMDLDRCALGADDIHHDADYDYDDDDPSHAAGRGSQLRPDLGSTMLAAFSSTPHSILQRRILTPNPRRHRQQHRRAVPLQDSPASWGCTVMDLDDFEEPAFLRAREEVDAD